MSGRPLNQSLKRKIQSEERELSYIPALQTAQKRILRDLGEDSVVQNVFGSKQKVASTHQKPIEQVFQSNQGKDQNEVMAYKLKNAMINKNPFRKRSELERTSYILGSNQSSVEKSVQEKLDQRKVLRNKQRVQQQIANQFKLRVKDRHGNNIKDHFCTWKAFTAVDTGQKQKFYISANLLKIPEGPQAYKMAKEDKKIIEQAKQRLLIPGLQEKDASKLEYWCMPPGICQKFYEHTKIRNLFDWQKECLNKKTVLFENKSLIYFAPTSGGKSIVSELLMLRAVLGQKKRAMYILPFVSIVMEKAQYLQRIVEDINFKIQKLILTLHSQVDNSWTPNVDLVICTIEKANSLINKNIEEGLEFDISFFIIDEFHLLLEKQRGYQLESLIAKLKTVEKLKQEKDKFQIVAMSATMSQIEKLQSWMDAEIYECQFRPVPLKEYILVDNLLQDKELVPQFEFGRKSSSQSESHFMEIIAGAYLHKKKAVLLFAPSKKACQDTCKKLDKALPLQFANYIHEKDFSFGDLKDEVQIYLSKKQKIDQQGEIPFDKEVHRARKRLISELELLPSETCPILQNSLRKGLAYHHSGLTPDEREIIERGYREGVILLICATSTLSTGINLPAKAVIFKGPMIATESMEPSKYKQMSGRAGRTGFDKEGNAVMVCSQPQISFVQNLMKPFKSDLNSVLDGQRLMKGLLEIICTNVVNTLEDIRVFVESTLSFHLCTEQTCDHCLQKYACNKIIFNIECDSELRERVFSTFITEFINQKNAFKVSHFSLQRKTENCRNCILEFVKKVLFYLSSYNFLVIKEDQIYPTMLGKASFTSCIPPEYSTMILQSLQNARKRLSLESELQIAFLITPHFQKLKQPNWDLMLKRMNKMSKTELQIAEKLGFDIQYVYKATVYAPKVPEFLKQQNQKAKKDDKSIKSNLLDSQSVVSSLRMPQVSSPVSSMNQSIIFENNSLMQEVVQISQLKESEKEYLLYSRFYTALIINEMLKETSSFEIQKMFQIERGEIQAIQALASNFAGMLTAFCDRANYQDLSIIFLNASDKINFSVKEELLDLMRVKSMKAEKARGLYNQGFTSLRKLIRADINSLAEAVLKNESFFLRSGDDKEKAQLKIESVYIWCYKVKQEAKEVLIKLKEADEFELGDQTIINQRPQNLTLLLQLEEQEEKEGKKLTSGIDREDLKKKIMKEANRSGQEYILESDTSSVSHDSISEPSESEDEFLKGAELSKILEEGQEIFRENSQSIQEKLGKSYSLKKHQRSSQTFLEFDAIFTQSMKKAEKIKSQQEEEGKEEEDEPLDLSQIAAELSQQTQRKRTTVNNKLVKKESSLDLENISLSQSQPTRRRITISQKKIEEESSIDLEAIAAELSQQTVSKKQQAKVKRESEEESSLDLDAIAAELSQASKKEKNKGSLNAKKAKKRSSEISIDLNGIAEELSDSEKEEVKIQEKKVKKQEELDSELGIDLADIELSQEPSQKPKKQQEMSESLNLDSIQFSSQDFDQQ